MKNLSENLGFQHHYRDTSAMLADKVDAAGGWNPDAVCVQFYHGIEDRHCVFSAVDRNTGWWTTVLTKDEYYWERMSATAKTRIREDIVRQIKRQIG